MKKQISFVFAILFLHWSLCFGGQYMEYSIKGGQLTKGTLKVWYQDGNTRTEFFIDHSQMMGFGKMTSIYLKSKPSKIFLLNEEAKTYTETTDSEEINTSEKEKDLEIQILESAIVNGYKATHVTFKEKGESQEIHYWFSREVKGFEEMKKAKSKYFTDSKMYKALKEKGIDGIPVKMKMQMEGHEIEMNLSKAMELVVDQDRFSLEGYQKTEHNFGLPPGFDLEKIKNMSPEERNKMMEEMMKKYGK